MRFFPPFLLVCLAAGAFACVHEDRRVTGALVTNESPPPMPQAPPQWLIGDPAGSRVPVMIQPLRGDSFGMIVDKRRIVIARGEPRVAIDMPPDPLAGQLRLPARLGGGFLFWTQMALFRADSYDGKLVPVATMPSQIEDVSIGPGYVFTRTANGERWALSVPKGERVALSPLGIVEIAASEDGRALAYDDRKAVFTSLDAGAHWSDVTAQMRGGGSPTKVYRTDDDEVWLTDSNDNAMRLEADGHLAWFDHAPTDPTVDFRPKDARWHGSEPPLRVAVKQGVALDERTALVLEGGDLVKIDTRTGEIVSIYGGHLPPDSYCQGLNAGGDIVFACFPRGNPNQGAPFVVSHVLSGEPVIEQTFAGGAEFYASDDGGLAYGASCGGLGPTPNGVPAVCVRMPGGQWEERDLGMLSVDGGVAPGEVVRWVPRADGRVVALLAEPTPGIYDPALGTLQDVSEEITNAIGARTAYPKAAGRYRYLLKMNGGGNTFVDTSWSFVGNTLRGQGLRGETFEISEDGKVKMSAFDLDGAFSGPLGLGKSKDGRMFQTNDRGVTWTEVAAPPTGDGALEIVACSSVGCDLNAFYRVGWQLRPPTPSLPPEAAVPAPSVRRVRGLELACRTSGPVVSKLAPRSDTSPDDLGIGAAKLPVADERYQYVRTPISRGIVNSWSQASASGVSDQSDTEQSPALRALVSGYSATQDDNSVFQVNGPNHNILALRRPIGYVAPFDLQGHVVRTSIGMNEVVAAGRRAGMGTEEILDSDPTEELSPFPIASADPNGVSADLGFYESNRTLVAVMRGERVRLAFRVNSNPNASGGNVTFSGAALGGNADEVALLEYDGSNVEHVYKLGPNGAMTDLFDVEPPNEAYHSANPDAVAVGPKNELGILRVPSGSDPPSALDPPYIVVPGQPSVALAPWSTVKFADDPACKAEPGGWRAVVQAIGPWIKVSTPELRVSDSPMLARVRWSEKRVCLEGFEVHLPGVTIRPGGATPTPVSIGTWLVGKGSQFARVSVAEGVEWRQPIECTVSATGP